MEQTDKEILQKLLAQRVAVAVNDVVSKERVLDEDISIGVDVNTPSCYMDDNGVPHTGRLITVTVDFISPLDDED